MIGHRTAIGLSLLGALLICAFAAQSASAAEAKNTTAVTCVKGAGNKDFKDAHCDEKVAEGTGEFGHVAIANGVETEIETTNAKTAEKTTKSTNATLKGTLAGAVLHIECETVANDAANKSFIRNTEVAVSKEHKVDGTSAVVFSNCKVLKPLNCTVGTITVSSKVKGVEGLGAGKNEMGLEFSSDGAGKEKNAFAVITLAGEKCAVKGIEFEVKGTAIATGTVAPTEKHSGATLVFANEKEMQKLEIGGKEAEFKGTFTTTMKEAGGNPIAGTTTT